MPYSSSSSSPPWWHSPVVLTLIGAALSVWFCSQTFSTSSSSSNLIPDCTIGRTIALLSSNVLSKNNHHHNNNDELLNNLPAIQSTEPLFTELPQENEKYFYAPCGKNCAPMIRALRTLGWQKVDRIQDGRLIYMFYEPTEQDDDGNDELQSWQRFSQLPHYSKLWSTLDQMVMNIHNNINENNNNKKWPYYIPESYHLESPTDRKALLLANNKDNKKRIQTQNWRLTKVGSMDSKKFALSKSDTLKTLLNSIIEKQQQGSMMTKESSNLKYTMQSMICQPLTYQRMPIILRSYWMIASLNPLLAFYQDGYARYGVKTLYKTTGDAMETTLEELKLPSLKRSTKRMLNEMQVSPMTHLRNQMKDIVGHFTSLFFQENVSKEGPSAFEDGFAVYSMDMVVDDDLNLWLLKAHNETRMPEDYYFHLRKNHEVFFGLGQVLNEVWNKQQQQTNSDAGILPLQSQTEWQLVKVHDYKNNVDWQYHYEGYKRTVKKKQHVCTMRRDQNNDAEADEVKEKALAEEYRVEKEAEQASFKKKKSLQKK